MGILLILWSFLLLMPSLREYLARNFRQDYFRFILSGCLFLFLSLFLCYPDSKWIRLGQVLFCLSYATVDFLLIYNTDDFGPFDIGLFVIGGLLYVRYDFPHREWFFMGEGFLFLFDSLWRSYVLNRVINFGSLLLYFMVIVAMNGKESFKAIFSHEDAPLPSSIVMRDFSTLDVAMVKDMLQQKLEMQIFTTLEIQIMSEFFCNAGNATNKELSGSLSVSESLIKNSISDIFKKVPEIHSRTGLYHYIQQQLIGVSTENDTPDTT